jgi:hypothetical protein
MFLRLATRGHDMSIYRKINVSEMEREYRAAQRAAILLIILFGLFSVGVAYYYGRIIGEARAEAWVEG